jgi:hypothetical protein
VKAQRPPRAKDTARQVWLLGIDYAFTFPVADLAKRFGPNSNVGGSVWYKTPSNWLFGAEYNYIFGTTIREKGILNHVESSDGYIIGSDGQYIPLKTFERGTLAFLKVGKVFPIFGPNPNSGITAKFGVGFMQHKIKYYWTGDVPAPLRDNYYKGYDRLTNGAAISQTIGYQNLSNSHVVNFSIEFEATEGFTQSRRDWNFDTMTQDKAHRLDVLLGFKLCWYLPIYSKYTSSGYYY